jgi:hypothetical protein
MLMTVSFIFPPSIFCLAGNFFGELFCRMLWFGSRFGRHSALTFMIKSESLFQWGVGSKRSLGCSIEKLMILCLVSHLGFSPAFEAELILSPSIQHFMR